MQKISSGTRRVALGVGASLANSGVQDITNLTQSVPSLTFEDAGPAGTRVVIRGIRSPGEPTVGIYYDETPVSGAVGSGNDAGGATPPAKLFDVERVEVLRGPQGTLYGSGSMGGTLRVIFNKPDFNYEAAVDADAINTSGSSGGYDAQGMVNVPIINDMLAARAVFRGGGNACSTAQQTAFNNYVAAHVPSALYDIQTIYNPTAEVRLSSAGKNFLDWTVGGFYSDRTSHANNSEDLADSTTGALLPQPAGNVYTRLIYDRLKQVEGFGEGSAHLTDALTLTFGARYFNYTRDVGGSTPLGLDQLEQHAGDRSRTS